MTFVAKASLPPMTMIELPLSILSKALTLPTTTVAKLPLLIAALVQPSSVSLALSSMGSKLEILMTSLMSSVLMSRQARQLSSTLQTTRPARCYTEIESNRQQTTQHC